MKNLTLTLWPNFFFGVNIHLEKPGKKFGEGEDEAGALLLEDARVLFTVGRCKRLHDSVNLKSFTRQPGDLQLCKVTWGPNWERGTQNRC